MKKNSEIEKCKTVILEKVAMKFRIKLCEN